MMLSIIITDDVDTRAITRRLREDGSLIGILSTENSKTDEELLQMSRSWDIVGMILDSDLNGFSILLRKKVLILLLICFCRH